MFQEDVSAIIDAYSTIAEKVAEYLRAHRIDEKYITSLTFQVVRHVLSSAKQATLEELLQCAVVEAQKIADEWLKETLALNPQIDSQALLAARVAHVAHIGWIKRTSSDTREGFVRPILSEADSSIHPIPPLAPMQMATQSVEFWSPLSLVWQGGVVLFTGITYLINQLIRFVRIIK